MTPCRLFAAAWLALALSAASHPATTIAPAAHHAWGANTGWLDARAGNGTYGAVFRTTFASGQLWSANTGWISLGQGAPANGVSYANTTGADFGVNHTGGGALRGLAWSANLGWIVFADTGDPRVELTTGALSGYAWSANAGWINLAGLVTLSPTTPVTADDAGERVRGKVELRFATAKLLGNDTDPDGRPLTLESVASPTAKGATVSLEGAWVVYRAPAGDAGDDSFTYVVRAGFGPTGAATGTVQVFERNDDVAGRDIVALVFEPGGGMRLIGAGIPGRTYLVQATEDLSPPVVWMNLGQVTADAGGVMEFLDLDGGGAPQRFYRLVKPPPPPFP